MNAKMRAARTANPNGGDVSTANGETDASTATNSDNGAMDNTANDNGGHTGAMVALVPQDSDLKRLAVPGGEEITQLHLTLMFLGEGSAYDMPMRDRVVNAMRQLSVDLPPIEGNGFAINMFNPNGGPDGQTPCVVLGVAGPELKYVHDRVEDIIQTEVDNQLVPEQHQPWIPHVTLMYSPDQELIGQLSDRTGDITFDTLRIAFADNVTDIPLGLDHNDMNEQLRSAMQPRIKANPLSPEVEYKGVRHVRTAAGERKYGQPIGSVIIDDGAGHTTPLAHLTTLPAQFEGWSRYQGSNGQNYEVGYDDEKKRFMASKEGSWRALHTGSSAEEVLQKLNASIAPKEKPAPKSAEAAAKRIAKSPTTSKPNAAQRAAEAAGQRSVASADEGKPKFFGRSRSTGGPGSPRERQVRLPNGKTQWAEEGSLLWDQASGKEPDIVLGGNFGRALTEHVNIQRRHREFQDRLAAMGEQQKRELTANAPKVKSKAQLRKMTDAELEAYKNSHHQHNSRIYGSRMTQADQEAMAAHHQAAANAAVTEQYDRKRSLGGRGKA